MPVGLAECACTKSTPCAVLTPRPEVWNLGWLARQEPGRSHSRGSEGFWREIKSSSFCSVPQAVSQYILLHASQPFQHILLRRLVSTVFLFLTRGQGGSITKRCKRYDSRHWLQYQSCWLWTSFLSHNCKHPFETPACPHLLQTSHKR